MESIHQMSYNRCRRQVTDERVQKKRRKKFYLGGAGGYPIVPGNKTEIVLELLLVCIRMEKNFINTKVKYLARA